MMANIIWKAMKRMPGMVRLYPGGEPLTLASPKKWKVPMTP